MIAGAGLAGVCAALWLSNTRPVAVLNPPDSSASRAAAGLVNPRMGPRAARVWQAAAALDALAATLDAAGVARLFRRTGIVRPARDAHQARRFLDADAANWLEPESAAERWPHVHAPHGALWVPDGGSVDVPALLDALLDAARANGAEIRAAQLVGWSETASGVRVETDGGAIDADRLLLAVGDGARHLPARAALPLHRIKGQTITLARPDALDADGPTVAGGTYAVPGPGGVVVGATYEHTFETTAPTDEATRALAEAAAQTMPLLAGASVLDACAGVRLTVPEHVAPGRLPVWGPMPGARRVWVLTALGSRGLLTAPLLASLLPHALDQPDRLPPEVSPRRLRPA